MQHRFQARTVVREQHADGLLEARQVTGDGLQEEIGALGIATPAVLVRTGAAGRSTSFRNATEAPPGCSASQAQ